MMFLQVLSDHKDALFVLIAIFIIFCTTGTLCLVFVPKVSSYIRFQRFSFRILFILIN